MALVQVMRVEWRRLWRNRLRRAGIFTALILPLLYSSLYLWAFWDPYGSLDKLPVAIINEDIGGQVQGQNVNYGKQFVKTLLQDKTLGWKAESAANADTGLQQGNYYMVLHIPKNFTENVTSVNTSNPLPATLEFTPNQGRNYLASQIVQRVETEVTSALSQTLSQQYFSGLLSVVGKEQNGLSTVAVQARRLENGAQSVNQGAVSIHSALTKVDNASSHLANGLSQMNSASGSMSSGLQQALSGTNQARAGVDKSNAAISAISKQLGSASGPSSQLATGTQQAATSTQQLTDGSAKLAQGTAKALDWANQLSTGEKSLTTGAAGLQQGLANAIQALNAYQQAAGSQSDANVSKALAILQQLAPNLTALQQGITQSAQGASSLAAGMQTVQTGQSQLTSHLNDLTTNLQKIALGASHLTTGLGKAGDALSQVHQGLQTVSNGLGAVTGGQQRLLNGSRQLQSAISQSSGGAAALHGGIQQVDTGSAKVASASGQLAQGQGKFANRVASASQMGRFKNTGNMAHMMAHPLQSKTVSMHPVTRYGEGLAPYFIPLSLWVGAFMLYFLIPLNEGRWRVTPVANWKVILGKMGVLWGIGILQAAIASSILLYGLGLPVTNVFGFYLFTAFQSITYITVIGMFVALFGTGPGRVIAIILLLLQLTSSGGTFPLELVPSFFQSLHPWLPMSWAVSGLRDLTALNNVQDTWRVSTVTACYFVFALVLLVVYSSRRIRTRVLTNPDELVP